jgi:DNA-binding protein HU-beta
MNQEQLVSQTAASINMQKNTVERCLHGLIDTIESSLRNGEKVTIHEFGTLKITHHKERIRINPRTLEQLVIPANNRVKFDTSPKLLNKIQGVNN